jgi:hypothetical protein
VGPASESIPLRRGDVLVARTRDDVDRLAQRRAVRLGLPSSPVRQHRDGLGAADRVDLVDPQECARREDRRVREAAVLALRRAGHHERRDPGLLRRDDVHHDRRGVDRQPAGDVEPDAAHGEPPLAHLRAGGEVHARVDGPLCGVHEPDPPDRLLERGADRGVEVGEGVRQRGDRDAQVLRTDPVEPLREVAECSSAALADVREDRGDHLGRAGHVELRTRQDRRQLSVVERAAAQVETGDHVAKSRSTRPADRLGPWIARPSPSGQG